MSVNGIPLENVDHKQAIAVLKDSGNKVNLVSIPHSRQSNHWVPQQPHGWQIYHRNVVCLGFEFYIDFVLLCCLFVVVVV